MRLVAVLFWALALVAATASVDGGQPVTERSLTHPAPFDGTTQAVDIGLR
jgi:hypothetical protein